VTSVGLLIYIPLIGIDDIHRKSVHRVSQYWGDLRDKGFSFKVKTEITFYTPLWLT